MPELPEVETIARQLDKVITNKKIERVEVLERKSFFGDARELEGRKIVKVDRHSKMIVWHLDNEEVVVMIHLKMTGQLVWRSGNKQVVGGHPSEDWNAKLPNNHTRVVIDLSDGSKLFFNDLRIFGWMKLVKTEAFRAQISKLPPDVVDEAFTFDYFSSVLGKSGRAIKLVLMDQQKIGGVGNIYANDALNLAKINPKRPAKSFNSDEGEKLYIAVKEVIAKGIKFGGATYSDYRDVKGQGGRYQEHFLVYNREGEKCQNCGGEIKKITLGGRGTYFCADCQK